LKFILFFNKNELNLNKIQSFFLLQYIRNIKLDLLLGGSEVLQEAQHQQGITYSVVEVFSLEVPIAIHLLNFSFFSSPE
jgi:hypothetical protein